MKFCASLSLLVAAVLVLGACQQSPTEPPAASEMTEQEGEAPAETGAVEDSTPGEIVATGLFVGRSGKPMANARLVLGKVVGNDVVTYATVKLVDEVSTAVADAEGRFEFKGFTPGAYTIVYRPSKAGGMFPVEIDIRSFLATTKSTAPLLQGFELGKEKPLAERAWGRRFTLLKGHTFYSRGQSMKIWNATIRQGPGGPYMEIRRNVLWTGQFDDNSEIKFEAWGY